MSNNLTNSGFGGSQSDATPAYRGYRLQALYTLAQLLEGAGTDGLIYQPEGKEDLAVYSHQQTILEIIQVKQRSQSLVLSSFEPEKKDSFFPRVAAQLRSTPNVKISIVVFGDVGPELQKAIQENGTDRARVARKIASFGHVSEPEALSLFEQTNLITIDETVLRKQVFAALENSLTGVDPTSAFELLSYWLYHCAENKSKIDRQILIERVNAVGRFAASRAAYHAEWFTSIIPLGEEQTLGRNELYDEFYRGVSTRYEHILADLDVVRFQLLMEIATKFRNKRVVIVHAASGQGKTALSYRYLHEYFPQSWRFQVRSVFDREHALRVALALKGHADALDVPIAIYLDVSPRDRDWPELVRSLSEHRNLQVLVSIREEDWKRAGILVMGFEFETVELSFERTEAARIYDSLVQKRPPTNVLNAEEAWERFGGAGPLMEFIYLVTQGDSLRTKLSQQITYLKNEVREKRLDVSEIELLRLVSIASASGARLRVKPLAEHLNLPAPLSTLELFEKEYLLRVSTEGIHVQGLHPIRSTILTDLLTDATFAPWFEGAVSCLPFIEEADLEIFFLHCFSQHREHRSEILHSLQSIKPTSWIGIVGMVRALIWAGIAEYVEANEQLIEEAVEQIGIGGWSYFIDFDIANVSDTTVASWWKELDFITGEVQEKLKGLQSRQTDKKQVFQYATRWLTDHNINPAPPTAKAEWSAIAETAFWVARLRVGWPLPQWLSEAELEWAIENLPLEILANLVSGLFENEEFHNWFLTNRQRLTARFRQDTDTVILEDDGQRLTARFIFTLPDLVDASDDTQNISEKAQDSFHGAAIQRLGLLRRLFPDRGAFSTQGYGHMLWEDFLQFDETIKTGIDRNHLPLVWLTSVNATFRGLGDLRFRPSTWPEYSGYLIDIRRSVLTSLKQLERGIENHFRRSRAANMLGTEVNGEQWDRCKIMLTHPPLLPRVAVDEWGFLEESTSDINNRDIAERLTKRSSIAAGRYKSFLKTFNEYTRTLSNFFSQATDCMITNPLLGRTNNRTKVLETAASLGIKPNSCKLATLNFADCLKNLNAFQREARKILNPFFDNHELNLLDKEEQQSLHRIWCAWYLFAYHPQKVMQNAVIASERESLQILRTIRLDLRGRLRRISSDLIRFNILSEDTLWDDRPVLWLSTDADSFLAALNSLPTVLDQVKQSVQKGAKSDLRRYILDLHWPHIAIVPLVKGKCTNTVAWRIALPVITESENESLRWWNYAPSPIPAEAIDQLKIESWNLPQLSVGAKLIQHTTILFYIAVHIRDFHRLPDLDEDGLTQLQSYVNRLSMRASEALQSVLDTEVEMLAAFNNLSQDDQILRPHLFESAMAIMTLHKAILPSDDFSDRLEMDLDGLINWATRLEQTPALALAASSAWASDVIEQALNDRTPSSG